MFLLQEKIYLSPITKIINNLFFSQKILLQNKLLESFFKKVRLILTNMYSVLRLLQN